MFTRKELTEWTSALRTNPEQQMKGQLANKDYTKFCCLGKLCEVRGIPRTVAGLYENGLVTVKSSLPADLAAQFTGHIWNTYVDFYNLGMPNLKDFVSAALANDGGCTWIEIADHFDKYYPCSDEQPA